MKPWDLIRENLGLKIGSVTAAALFSFVLLFAMIFGGLPVEVFSKFTFLQSLLLFGVVLTFLAFLVASVATHLLIRRPLTRLTSVLRQVELGQGLAPCKNSNHDEVENLLQRFNQMIGRLRCLENHRLSVEQELNLIQEELRSKALIEEKTALVVSANQNLEKSLKELRTLYTISQALTASLDPEELCNKLSEVISENVPVSNFAILLREEGGQELKVKSASGFENNDLVRQLSFTCDEGISGRVLREAKTLYVADTSSEPVYLHYKGMKLENGSFLCVPMVLKEEVLGVINFFRRDTYAFSEEEIFMLSMLASQMAIAVENARLYAKTKELSLIDDLTKVFNRRHFQKILEMEFKRAKRFQRPLSLLMIDVDHFKSFNDRFGHLEGDRMLIEIARIFQSNLREVDTLARYGGEEFAVILPNTSLEDACKVGEKLKNFVEQMSELRERQSSPRHKITVSVGVAALSGSLESAESLLNRADRALYQAKTTGRNRVMVLQDDQSQTCLDFPLSSGIESTSMLQESSS